jgi:hypothetical protein
MTSPGWSLLDEKDEADLHKSRLLNVEEKPFKRITKRLQTLNALATSAVRQAPTPPPESSSNGDQQADDTLLSAEDARSLAHLKEDITLDFAAFDSSIARLQFLLTANARERDRYAADRGRIQETSQRVRDNTSALRRKLDEAKATLEQRRKFDELADRITANPRLKPRAEQEANLARLEDECGQLEAESEEYATTWRERREQFQRIMDESMRLRRQIRDEKEEVERREGMDDDGGGGVDGEGTPGHGLVSGSGTPRPDGVVGGGVAARIGGLESGDGVRGTPRAASTVGGRTPARDGSVAPGDEGRGRELKVRPEGADGFSRAGSRAASREGLSAKGSAKGSSPKLSVDTQAKAAEGGAGSDVEMDSPLTPVPDDDDEIPTIVLKGEEGEGKMDTT